MLQQHSCACTAWKYNVGGEALLVLGPVQLKQVPVYWLAVVEAVVSKFEAGACNGSPKFSPGLDRVRICLVGELFLQFKDGQTSNIMLIKTTHSQLIQNSLLIRGEHGH